MKTIPAHTKHAQHNKWKERLKFWAILLAVLSGWLYGMHTDSQTEEREASAYYEGSQNMRQILKSGGDVLLTSQVCTAWWFGNNAVQHAATRKQLCGGKS